MAFNGLGGINVMNHPGFTFTSDRLRAPVSTDAGQGPGARNREYFGLELIIRSILEEVVLLRPEIQW